MADRFAVDQLIGFAPFGGARAVVTPNPIVHRVLTGGGFPNGTLNTSIFGRLLLRR
jgi:hypothetical protein